ncbi:MULTISPECIES: TetR/AcrR family transcriptional regulator [unclassified Pantoea]|uniref:TetR/AcrR family transcriptional regulator n=1 Tax=unclassified Pantoea TaxID=2630326 RepID=UPI001231B9E0|nr:MULTISPECIES: TetR/AcrR family transcriptional regulator [unclassified Pantoea]KAA6100081.1 TetR/AcrR family transcriptional regulator [Pantoea sp. B_9]KAA6117118.1 TetR/AcrR family transcriptional regulator [Pantoea sp. B_10]
MTAQKVMESETAPSDKPRRPGRPRGGAINAQQREHLLDITLALYAQNGIAETSLNAIARKAGVSPAMLNYYFQSRESLLDTVVAERFVPLRQRLEAHFVEESSEPVAAISGFIKEFADIVLSHDWFAPLWLQEVASGQGLGGTLKQRHGHAGRERIRALLIQWQQQGLLNNQLNVDVLMTSILSMVLVPFTRFAHEPGFDTEMILQHTLSMVCQGIQPRN